MRNLLLTAVVALAACASRSDAPRAAEPAPTDPRPTEPAPPPTTHAEAWTLRFDPPLETEGGLGPHGLVWSEVVMAVSIDLGADALVGTSTWTYGDTAMQANATLAGTRTGAHVQLTVRTAGGDEFLVLEGDEQGGQVTGTATLTAHGPILRQRPPWQGRFTMVRGAPPRGL